MYISSATAMALLRVVHGVINLTAAFLIYKFGTPEAGLRINAIVGSIGPVLFTLIALIGVAGASANLQTYKIIMIIAGITLIVLGTR